MSPTPDRKNSGSGKKPGKKSGNGPKGPQLPGKTMGFWVLLAFLVYLAYTQLAVDRTAIHELTYSAFREQVETGNIRTIAKTNLDGGALALGHPLGATGARITGKVASLLKREDKSLGLATQCIGGGQGIATVLEAC